MHMDNISKPALSRSFFCCSFWSPAVLLMYTQPNVSLELYLIFYSSRRFFFVSTRNRFRVLFLHSHSFYVFLYVSNLAHLLIFPKSHPIKFLNLFFALHSRISLRCWWCQIYVLRERRTSSCHRKSAFMKNKNCETEIKLNSKQQFTSFNGCSFFLLFSSFQAEGIIKNVLFMVFN